MATEIEIKLRVPDPLAMRQRLLEAGAAPARRMLEHNTYFDTPDGRLKNADCGLRIRVIHEPGSTGVPPVSGNATITGETPVLQAILTFKGPRRPGKLKVRQEEELTLSSPEPARRILEQLGYQAVASFQKRRETFELAGAEISLDELPELGFFLEIEADDEQTVHRLVRDLGLSEQETVTTSYIALVVGLLDQKGGKVRELAF